MKLILGFRCSHIKIYLMKMNPKESRGFVHRIHDLPLDGSNHNRSTPKCKFWKGGNLDSLSLSLSLSSGGR